MTVQTLPVKLWIIVQVPKASIFQTYSTRRPPSAFSTLNCLTCKRCLKKKLYIVCNREYTIRHTSSDLHIYINSVLISNWWLWTFVDIGDLLKTTAIFLFIFYFFLQYLFAPLSYTAYVNNYKKDKHDKKSMRKISL